MSDLYVDGAMLQRVRDNFAHISDLLHGPANRMKSIDGTHVGPDLLRQRVNQFGDDWDYGIGQLNDFSGSVVDSLTSLESTFKEADDNLAQALNDALEGGR